MTENEDGPYFDLTEEDVLHDAYMLALDRGYTVGDLAPLREIILTETSFDRRALTTAEEYIDDE